MAFEEGIEFVIFTFSDRNNCYFLGANGLFARLQKPFDCSHSLRVYGSRVWDRNKRVLRQPFVASPRLHGYSILHSNDRRLHGDDRHPAIGLDFQNSCKNLFLGNKFLGGIRRMAIDLLYYSRLDGCIGSHFCAFWRR